MTVAAFVQRLLPAGLVLAAVMALPAAAAPAPGQVSTALSDPVVLAPHRAIYDLRLVKSRGTRAIDAVAGRILYDFSGNACEGYTLDFRQVSDMESEAGRSVVSDMRSVTWEDSKARSFRFNTTNRLNDDRTTRVDGQAERDDNAVQVRLSKPTRHRFDVSPGTVFPTEHMRRIIEAARQGKTMLSFPVYDGSDTGLKVYNTLTIIGKEIPPGAAPPNDAAADVPAMAKLARWPVTISYFEQESAAKQQTHEQTPTYVISFELYENGISRALLLQYSDFTLAGKMTALTLKTPKPCQ
ncbi:MAG TPA: cell envelope integrity EipB family protein [Pseudolabrys sp.]|nr:cell envelope integrity EipB family protein [Pseudolabrys sp.]